MASTPKYRIIITMLVGLTLTFLKGPTKPAELLGASYLLVPAPAPMLNLVGRVTSGIFSENFGRKKAFGFMIIIPMVVVCFLWLSGFVPHVICISFTDFLGGVTYTVGAIFLSKIANTSRCGRLIASAFAMQSHGELFSFMITMINFSSPSVNDKFKDYFIFCNLLIPAAAAGYFLVKRNLIIISKKFDNQHRWHLLGIIITSFLCSFSNLSRLIYLNLSFQSDSLVSPAEQEMHLFIARFVSVFVLLFLVFFIDPTHRLKIHVACFFIKAVLMVLALRETPWKKNDNITEIYVFYVFDSIVSNFASATRFDVKIFPRRMRATCQGISDGASKFGDIMAAIWFLLGGHYFELNFCLLFLISMTAIVTSFLAK